ncbi:MAG TPA: hypothetical protein VJ844_04210 [Mucilaginibacter sp.]|nr:hypothetical protein [Mucilaginibacter sp.]
MKKTLLIMFIVTIASQLKAQQLTLKPTDSLLLKSPLNLQGLKLNDSTQLKNYFNKSDQNTLALLNTLKGQKSSELFYSTMPVAKMGTRDKMSVVKPGDSNMKFNMPVKKVTVIDPLAKKMPATP